ncbi:hypothetical protein AB0B15_14385 [Streptomyces sp. NPDC045456]|uniref:VG15 protein n=1 Tax=Streptomyces sp. NPDC045456 TaxID=3155254 RepID=UPI0033CF5D59
MMATAADLAAARYQQVTRTERSLVALIQRLWRRMSAATIEEELEGEAGAAILAAVVTEQISVAQGAQAFVAASMAAQGGAGVAEAALSAAAFAGLAPGGGSLETLLYVPAVGVQRRLAAGTPPQEAMLGGLADMAMYATTAVADTARSSAQVAMAADPQVVAYTRVVNLPACSRCIVLAGQQYAYSEGFLRHPRCDCQTVPLREKEWAGVQSPRELYEAMSEAERRRAFTVAGARAVGEGADIGQVVNARRGMSAPDAATTSEGATRRGLYGRRMRRAGGGTARIPGERYARTTQSRLTPEEIFRRAEGRAEQLRLLRRYGYLV